MRRYKSEDCGEIIKLFYNTVHFINIRDYNEEQLHVWAPKDIDITSWNKSLLEHYSVVVEENGIIIGFGDIDSTGYFDRLYVHKDYQRIGVATIIANELEKYAEKENINIITTHGSITAKPFFEKRGYKTLNKQSVEKKGQVLTNFIIKKFL